MRLMMVALVAFGGVAFSQQPSSDSARVAAQAVKMLRSGQQSLVWSLLRQTEDNTTRSFIIRDLARAGVSPDVLIDRLRSESDVSARRGLLLALGGYRSDLISPPQRESLVLRLREWYEKDPDAGIHSAIQWLLRGLGYGSTRVLPPMPLSKDRQWYSTAEGQTMTMFVGPLSLRMGSPGDETGRQPASDSAAEPVHVIAIPRSFAIATTEVTVEEFRRFLDANPDAKRGYQYQGAPARMAEVLARFSPAANSPAIAVTWYEAAMYCNWLSARWPRLRRGSGSSPCVSRSVRAATVSCGSCWPRACCCPQSAAPAASASRSRACACSWRRIPRRGCREPMVSPSTAASSRSRCSSRQQARSSSASCLRGSCRAPRLLR